MKLDRDRFGRNKYALIKNRKLEEVLNSGLDEKVKVDVQNAIATLAHHDIMDVGDHPSTEFFVMRLKDRFAGPALNTYSQHAAAVDIEYAGEVAKLAKRAGMAHPNCKNPD